MEHDASGVGIGAILTQIKKPLAYFSEKLNDPKFNYSTYDKEFYTIVRTLNYWSHYLKLKASVLHSDHHALKFLNSHPKLNAMYAEWESFSKLLPSLQGTTRALTIWQLMPFPGNLSLS